MACAGGAGDAVHSAMQRFVSKDGEREGLLGLGGKAGILDRLQLRWLCSGAGGAR